MWNIFYFTILLSNYKEIDMQTLNTHELEQVSGGFTWTPSCSFISTLANFLKTIDPEISLLPTRIAIEMASDVCAPRF